MSLLTNLIAYYKLDEASGTRADSTANAYDLTDNASVGSGTGKIGNAATFAAASSQFLSRTSNSDLQVGTADFTFACWVKLDQTGATACIASKRDNVEWELRQESDGHLRLFFGANTISVTANTFGALGTGTWYYVVVWHDSANSLIGISVNDVADTASDAGSGAATTSGAFRIGSENGAGYYSGSVDEAGFWKRTLTSGERTQLYGSGSGLAYPFSGGGTGRVFRPARLDGLGGVGEMNFNPSLAGV